MKKRVPSPLLFLQKRTSACLVVLVTLLVEVLFSFSARAQGGQWQAQSSGLLNNPAGINDFSIVSASVAWAIGYSASNPAVTNQEFTRTVNGTSWVSGSLPGLTLDTEATSISAVDANTAWVTMSDNLSNGGFLYRTINGGSTWTRQATTAFPAAQGGYANYVHMYSATNGVCLGDPVGGYYEIYRTANGTTWQRVPSANIPVPLNGELALVGTFVAVGNKLWFGTNLGRVFYSSDQGATWAASTVSTGNQLRRIAFTDATNGLATTFNTATSAQQLYRTTNGGVSWTAVMPGGSFFTGFMAGIPGTNTFVSTANTGSSYSTNGGQTWVQIDALGHTAVRFLDNQTGYSGGFTGQTYPSMYRWLPNPAAGTFCTPLQPACGLASGPAITNVSLPSTGLNVGSACANTNGAAYTRYPATPATNTASLAAGGFYSITVAVSSAATVGVWIDYNQNSLFEASEFTLLGSTSGPGQATGTIRVPTTIVLGLNTMRVRARAAGTPIASTEACSSFANGEAEDYVVTLTAAPVTSTAPAWAWAQKSGAAGSDDQAFGVATDPQGNSYVTGSFSGTMTLGSTTLTSSGLTDGFLAKYDRTGAVLWARRMGGSGADRGQGVALDASTGDVVCVGSFSGTMALNTVLSSAGGTDLFVARYTPAGTVQWAVRGGGSGDDEANHVAVNTTGIAVSAFFSGTASFAGVGVVFSQGGLDALLLRYTSTGALQWVRTGGGVIGDDNAEDVAMDASGNVYATGVFDTQASFGATTIAGSGREVFVVSYTTAGTMRWLRQSQGDSDDYGNGIAVDAASGSVYITGDTNSSFMNVGAVSRSFSGFSNEFFLLKLTSAGTAQWLQGSTSGTNESSGRHVKTDASGNIYVAGDFTGTLRLGTDVLTTASPTLLNAFVGRFNAASGTPAWGKQVLGTSTNGSRAYGLGLDASGNIYVTGVFAGTATFSPVPALTANGLDYFVAMLGSLPCVPPVANAGAAAAACGGSTVALGAGSAQAGISYDWTVSPAIPGFALSAAQGTVLLPVVATTTVYTFTLTATAGAGCSASSQVLVTANAAPAAPVGGSASRCGTGAVGLSASGSSTYRWYTTAAGGIPIAGATASTYITPSLSMTTTYYVSAVSAQGCESARTAVTATINAVPVANAGPARSICSGSSAVLGSAAVAGISYSWSPATGLSSSAAAQPTITLTNATGAPITTNYTLTATSTAGCVATSTVSVTVNPAVLANAGPARAVCSGVATQLGSPAVAGVAYSWSPATGLSSTATPQPTATLVNTGSSPMTATYTLTATNAQGCTATSTVAVTVNPAAVANAGPARSVCSGSAAVLGSPAVAGATYSWSPATGLSSATAAQPTVTLSNTTGTAITTTYTLTATTANGCLATSTVLVTVNPATSAAFSYPAPRYCLNAAAAPVPTVTGTAGGTFAATPAGLSINPATGAVDLSASTAGSYVVTYSVAGSCPSSSTATLMLEAAPVASISASSATSFCQGGSVTLTASSGAAYAWSNGQTTPSITVGAAGNYTVTVTSASGCSTTSAATTVTVNPTPATPTITRTGNTLTSSASTGNQWYLDGNLIPGATGVSYVISAAGAYTVVVTSSGCASSPSAPVLVTGAARPLAGTSLQVYPNPTPDGRLTVELQGYHQAVELTLFNALGQAVLSRKVPAAAAGQPVPRLALENLAAGVYILQAASPGGLDTRRVVVSR